MSKAHWKQALLLTLLLGGAVCPAMAADEKVSADIQPPKSDMVMVPGDMALGDDDDTMMLSNSKGIMRPLLPSEIIERQNQKQQEAMSPMKRGKGKKGEEPVDTSISPENPMTVKADRMQYNKTTGDVAALGQVDIRHMMDTYQTEYVYGNTITQKYVAPGTVTWRNPTTNMKAGRAEFDAAKNVGKFEGMSGWEMGTYYFQGSSGIYDRTLNKMVVKDGYFTTLHAVAKVPDYRIEAESIDIYPGDHYTAHNVKLKFKNTTIITLKSYSGSLKPDEGQINLWSLIPRPMYSSDNGWGLHNSLEIPLGGINHMNPTFYWENEWYTKAGYKPDVGLKYRTSVGTFRFHYAEKESSTNDDGGIWVKKRPSLEFDSNHFYLFGSRFYVGAHGEIGYWDEDQGGRTVKGSYKGHEFYISGDPWKLGKFMTFSWKAGYAHDYYGYLKDQDRDHIRRNGYYQLGLSGHYGPLAGWVYYTDRDMNDVRTPYDYDTYSTEKPVDGGIRWQITHMDAVSLAWEVDTINGILTHRYWTYYRDMHSFYAWIRYDDIEKETRFMIMPKDFKF